MSSTVEEKWMIPCGKRIDATTVHDGPLKSTKEEMLTLIIEQSKRSYQQASEFKDKFAKQIFKMNWSTLHGYHKSYPPYSWLPGRDKIPKGLGEQPSQDHLDSLELEKTLVDVHEYLQLIAVGLDQIVIDESNRKSALERDFLKVEEYGLTVLCEVQTMISELKYDRKPDVQRSVFPEDLKDLDYTDMNMRNFMILRDYLNILEYATACFEHLKTKV